MEQMPPERQQLSQTTTPVSWHTWFDLYAARYARFLSLVTLMPRTSAVACALINVRSGRRSAIYFARESLGIGRHQDFQNLIVDGGNFS